VDAGRQKQDIHHRSRIANMMIAQGLAVV